MPFDFQKYDAKCAGLTPEELQREWQHYTRLITGAATSTTVSGLALPLTAGVSSIGIALAAPAIHNARKKREIVEKHLNSHQLTHVTRKRDVLGGVAVSGTIGVVTLGVGTLGADAIAAQGAEHGISAIVENDTAIKVVTHAALDGAGLAVEHAHTNHLKKKEAHKAFQAAGVFEAVADAKAAEAGYAVAGAGVAAGAAGAGMYAYNYNDPNQTGFASSSNTQTYYTPPPAYTSNLGDPNAPPTYYSVSDPNAAYASSQYYPADVKVPLDGSVAPTPSPYQQQQQQQQQVPMYSTPYVTSQPVPSQDANAGAFDMRSVNDALPNRSATPQVAAPQMNAVPFPVGHQELAGTVPGDVASQPQPAPTPAPSSLPFHMQAPGRVGTPDQQQGNYISPRSSISQPTPSPYPSTATPPPPSQTSTPTPRMSAEVPRDALAQFSIPSQIPQPTPTPMPFHMQAPGSAPTPAPAPTQFQPQTNVSPRHSISYSGPTPLPSNPQIDQVGTAYLSPRSSISYATPSPLSASHTPLDYQNGTFAPSPASPPQPSPMPLNPQTVAPNVVYADPAVGQGQVPGQWAGQPQPTQVSYTTSVPVSQPMMQGQMQGQMPPTPPVSTPGSMASQHSGSTVSQSYVLATHYGHGASQSVSYIPATTPAPQQGFFSPQPTPPMSQVSTGGAGTVQYYPVAGKPQFDPAVPQSYQNGPESQMFPPTPQSLPITPAGPTYGVATNNYFPPPPTGH